MSPKPDRDAARWFWLKRGLINREMLSQVGEPRLAPQAPNDIDGLLERFYLLGGRASSQAKSLTVLVNPFNSYTALIPLRQNQDGSLTFATNRRGRNVANASGVSPSRNEQSRGCSH